MRVLGRHEQVEATFGDRFRFLLRPQTALSLAAVILVLTAVGVLRISTLAASSSEGRADPGATQSASTAVDTSASTTPAVGSQSGQPLGYGLTQAANEQTGDDLTVYVSGAVRNPGVVTIPSDARVVTAIEAAGGFTDEANQVAINLAQPLTDGVQIHVPAVGEAGDAASTSTPLSASDPQGCVDLNTADATQLEELPGIGPKLAAAIVEERTSGGAFSSSADLDRVPGIGTKLAQRASEGACQ